MRLTWVQPEDLLPHQLVQSRSEGVSVDDVAARWVAAGGSVEAPVSGASAEPADDGLRALALELLDELDVRTPTPAPFVVPADLVLPGATKSDRVVQAWAGRAAGCLLGKPVEKIPREGIREILTSSGQWPLRRYITAKGVPDEVQARWPWNRRSRPTSLRENINGMPEDDDLNFAILALGMVERFGSGLTTEAVAQTWLDNLPAGRVFTAERVAYRNLLAGVPPERAALVRNPFREWIGAQIRTDVYGWVNPGDLSAAARLAVADASLSHTGAGVEGAVWVAAMSAATLVLDDAESVIEASLSVLPVDGAIATAVRFGASLADLELDKALDELHASYGGLHWVHSVNNTALTAYALTAAQGDFGTGIGIAVMGGWDTDSAGATVGAVLGALYGVPDEWAGLLRNRIATSLPGPDQLRIDDLAQRTVEAANQWS